MRLIEAIRLPCGRAAWREIRDVWRREGLDPLTIDPKHVARLAEILERRFQADKDYACMMPGLLALAVRKRVLGR